jgi:hypothetical protein
VRTILRRWRATSHTGITYCEACGEVCDPRCRADAIRGRARTQALAFRVGLR